ncbi:MAG: hypothetical protein ACKPDI_13380 [Actinomycetota bacterium]
MQRFIPVLAVAFLGLGACSSDSTSEIKAAVSSASAAANTAGEALGSAADCAAVYKELTGAMVAGMAPGSVVDFEKAFATTKDAVPEELKDDVEVLAKALVEIGKRMQANPTDANAMQELVTALSSAEVQQASDALNAYFGGGCG